MAAVRRSSDSGIIVALVIFILLFVVGLIGAIWSYLQLRTHQVVIAQTQDYVDKAIQPIFNQNNWDLKRQTPSEFGVRYAQDSFTAVADKLKEAAEYEKDVQPMLGWESLAGMKAAMDDLAIQKEAADKGDAKYKTLRLLLERYDESYRDLTRRVADQLAEQQKTTKALDDTQTKLTDTQKKMLAENSANLANFQKTLGDLQKANADLQARIDQHRQEAISWQQKLQQQINTDRTELAKVQAESDDWQKKYEAAVAPPAGRVRPPSDGRIIESHPEHDFVVIEGGKDVGRLEDETFVVYAVTPAGTGKRKGTILVGQVMEHTSIATVLDEEGGYVLVGDEFVSLPKWNEYSQKIQTLAAQK